jgi:hypothetical protein
MSRIPILRGRQSPQTTRGIVRHERHCRLLRRGCHGRYCHRLHRGHRCRVLYARVRWRGEWQEEHTETALDASHRALEDGRKHDLAAGPSNAAGNDDDDGNDAEDPTTGDERKDRFHVSTDAAAATATTSRSAECEAVSAAVAHNQRQRQQPRGGRNTTLTLTKWVYGQRWQLPWRQ